jgi:dynein heavy chain
LAERVDQYFNWTEMWQMPKSVCLSYLFNPMSFITAVVQSTAREKNLPLDNMCIQTNVMPFFVDEVQGKAEEGYFIHGLFIEGATWELGQTDQEGYLIPSILQVRNPAFPVIQCIAVILKDKRKEAQIITPVFVTTERGETFVTDFNLTMESDEFDKKIWILSGVALLLTNE